MAGHSWALLPSVLIVEIFSYLSLKDRLNASLACRRWRSYLFQPRLWPSISLSLQRNLRSRNNFLTDVCGRFVRKCIIKFDPQEVQELRDCLNILMRLKDNKSIQILQLEPVSSHFIWTDTISTARFIKAIEAIATGSRRLKHLSVGCSEELQAYLSSLLDTLAQHQGDHLESLHMASVKEDSEEYGIVDLHINQLKNFTCLQHLSIDYDFVDSEFLQAFTNKTRSTLKSLVIHVHGVDPQHEVIPNTTWQQFSACNQSVQVTLNLVHSFSGVQSLLDILKPNLPLTNFRQFFCSKVNNAALGLMASHYSRTLKSVHIIDGFESGRPIVYDNWSTTEDPFVMLAWKCPNLENFTLIGYEIMDEDVIAIARLRGEGLRQLNIPECCILEDHIAFVEEDYSVGFVQMVSASLCRDWKPMSSSVVPAAVFDELADAEQAYNHLFLNDQQYSSV